LPWPDGIKNPEFCVQLSFVSQMDLGDYMLFKVGKLQWHFTNIAIDVIYIYTQSLIFINTGAQSR